MLDSTGQTGTASENVTVLATSTPIANPSSSASPAGSPLLLYGSIGAAVAVAVAVLAMVLVRSGGRGPGNQAASPPPREPS